jgi:hypothetical protein
MMRTASKSAVREDDRVPLQSTESPSVAELIHRQPAELATPSPVAPFLIGTVIGGIAGALLGTLLSPHTRGYLIGLYHLLNRRLSSSERDQLRFELLLQ